MSNCSTNINFPTLAFQCLTANRTKQGPYNATDWQVSSISVTLKIPSHYFLCCEVLLK